MSEPMPAEVVLWQQMGKYLKTETEVSKPEVIPCYPIPKRGRPTEVVHVKVRFSNMAPDEPDLPKIVFTGVGLGIVRLPDPHPGPKSRLSSTREPESWWARFGWKVEQPASKQQSRTVLGASGGGGEDPGRWVDLTRDESAHGIALFPGDSATLELTIPVEDISKYEFHVQGSISRRHFFHYDQIVNIPQI
jgi:hypothetical protein